MKNFAIVCALCLLVATAALTAQNKPAAKKFDSAELARGKYLVESIGMCGDCHTPINEMGQPVMDKNLQGATLMFKPTVPIPGWADRSANIAGLKGWTDEESIKFLTTGVDPNGKQAAPPMPQFRYSKADAAAITAYLRSLAPAAVQSSSK
ncbi:MAG TPA: c-type cytochrome [Candidatus Koribacter sp.]|jgi:mono/diheme cytochrome c family protein